MSELITAPAGPQNTVENTERVVEKPSQPPVLITEQEVVFSTAVAASFPRTKPSPKDVGADSDRIPPRHYPGRREAFLESAAMAREMYRL